MDSARSALRSASLRRRLASMFYELLVVIAIAFCCSFPFHDAASTQLSGHSRHLFQAYLFLVVGLYFVACWARGGQTLPMKTWRLRLVTEDGQRVTATKAVLRYLLAWICLVPAGASLLWSFFDREGQFLHDRLARTRIVDA